jgi:hypothetical protein
MEGSVSVNAGRLWKVLGVAGLVGVAATGAVLARGHRQRTQMTADEVRERLHARLAAGADPTPGGDPRG